MKQTIRRVLLLTMAFATMLTLTGCKIISLESFKFHGAKVLNINISDGATVEMTIENTSPFKVTIVGGELAAYNKSEPIGEIYMKNPVVLPRKSTTTVTVDIGFRFSSPLMALRALGTLTSFPDAVTVSGYGEGKVWFFSKRFERRNVPLSKFISIFGDVSNYI